MPLSAKIWAMLKGYKTQKYKTVDLSGVWVNNSTLELPGIKATWKIYRVIYTQYRAYPDGRVEATTHAQLKRV